MAINTPAVTLVGNATAEPKSGTFQDGTEWANFSIAVQRRYFDKETNEWKDGPASFYRVKAKGKLARHVAQSIAKGQQVIVVGSLNIRDSEDQAGNQYRNVEVDADHIGPSLAFGTARFSRATENGLAEQYGRADEEQAAAPAEPARVTAKRPEPEETEEATEAKPKATARPRRKVASAAADTDLFGGL